MIDAAEYQKQYSVYKLKQEQQLPADWNSSSAFRSPVAHYLSGTEGGPIYISRDQMVQIYQDPDVMSAYNGMAISSAQIHDRKSKSCTPEIIYSAGHYFPTGTVGEQYFSERNYVPNTTHGFFVEGTNLHSREQSRRARVLDTENSTADKKIYYVPRYS